MSIFCGVISDTHVPSRARRIPERVFEIFQEFKVNHIFHAGDLVELSVLDSFKNLNSEIIACYGNMDRYPVRKQLPKLAECTLMNYKIAVIHDLSRFPVAHSDYNIIISGHTHSARIEQKGDTYLMNPGSPTNYIVKNRTVGILELTEKQAKGQIITL